MCPVWNIKAFLMFQHAEVAQVKAAQGRLLRVQSVVRVDDGQG